MAVGPPPLSGDTLKSEPNLDEEKKRGRARKERGPQPPPRPSLPKKEPTTAEIGKTMGELLSMTAIVHSLPQLPNLQCDYCRKRILDQAPKSGQNLAKLSEDYPALRAPLAAITRFFGGLSIMGEVTELYGPSFVHHGPAVLEPAAVMFPDMPPRKPKVEKKGKSHASHAATAGTAQPPPSTVEDGAASSERIG